MTLFQRRENNPLRMLFTSCLACGLLAATLTPSDVLGQSIVRIHSSQRYLCDETGNPYLLVADAAWSIMTYPGTADMEFYIDRRATEGFNALITALPPPWPKTPQKGINAYGAKPWTGQPFISPNEVYFAHADTVIDYAASKGMMIIIVPAFIGYECSVDGYGWSVEMQARTDAEMYAWGRWIGARYANRSNVIWSAGGDCDPTLCTNVRQRMLRMVAGIRDVDSSKLFTNHNQRNTLGVDYYPDDRWISLNNIYVDPDNLCALAKSAWETDPPKPFFLIEGYFEEDQYSPSLQTLRAQAYRTMLMGGSGFTFGNLVVYTFGHPTNEPSGPIQKDWRTRLPSAGSNQQIIVKRLMESRRWHLLVPDLSHSILTAGYGQFGATDFVASAGASDGSSIIAYLPTSRAITVDPSNLTGTQTRVWWVNPSSGAAINAGIFDKSVRTLSPPVAGDWVLVIDDASIGFPVPGQADSGTGIPHQSVSTPVTFLEVAYPNPFNSQTAIQFVLSQTTPLRLRIVDLTGSVVKTLVDSVLQNGAHRVLWDGTNASGESVSTGVYFVVADADDIRNVRKLVLVR